MKNNFEYPIRTFEHEQFGTLRALMLDGEPWFVSRDATNCLGYQETASAIYRHVPAKEKTIVSLNIGHGNNRTSVINARGLLRLADESFMPGAKKFACWVRKVVLPALQGTCARTDALQEDPDEARKKTQAKMPEPPQPPVEAEAKAGPAGKPLVDDSPEDDGSGFFGGLLIIIVEET